MSELPPSPLPAPSPWPPRVAMILGVMCLGGAVWSQIRASQIHGQVEAVARQVEGANPEGGVAPHLAAAAPNDAQTRTLVRQHRALRKEASTWTRRRTGLGLAGLVLLVGGFLGSGMLALHHRMQWAMVDEEPKI